MNLKSSLRGAVRRMQETRLPGFTSLRSSIAQMRAAKSQPPAPRRRTTALPSVLTSYSSREALPKPTPVNLRKFAETPVARKAINTIKDRIACMSWRIQPKDGRSLAELPEGAARVRTLTDNVASLNYDDSSRSFAAQRWHELIISGSVAA